MRTQNDVRTTAPDAAPWADRLAQRRRCLQEAAQRPRETVEAWIPGAIALLWTLFDQAVEQATSALKQAGLGERIVTRRTSREYWLAMAGPAGGERQIAVFVSLRAAEDRAYGGAQITTSQTRAAIHLVPQVEGGRLRWLMPATETAFTAHVVDDLLLSVFADDPAATARLSRCFTMEEGA